MSYLRKYVVLDNVPWSVEDRHCRLRYLFGPCYVQVALGRTSSTERETLVAVSIPESVEPSADVLEELDMVICYAGSRIPMRGLGWQDFVKTSKEARHVS